MTDGQEKISSADRLNGIEAFDAGLFGITPREAQPWTPNSDWCWKTAFAALEYAGIAPMDLKSSNTGVFIGVADNGMPRWPTETLSWTLCIYPPENAVNVIAGRVA